MPTMVVRGQVQTGLGTLDRGITDLMLVQTTAGPMLYATSGSTGGLAAYTVAGNGALSLADHELFSAPWASAALHDLSLVTIGGTQSLAVAGSGTAQVRLFDLATDGTIGLARQISGLGPTVNRLLDIDQSGNGLVYMADTASDLIRGYEITGAPSLTLRATFADTATTYAAETMALANATVGGADYLITASQSESGVSAFRIQGTTLVNSGNAGVAEGLGIMAPTAMEVVEIGGRIFVVLASAPGGNQGQSGAITVLELAADGSLVSSDHVMDTSLTRFGNVQSMAVVEADGRTYVIAGGGDDGLTLFALMPTGRLQMLDILAESGTAWLKNVSAIAAHHAAGEVQVFATSEVTGGITRIAFDTTTQGSLLQSSHAGGALTGTVLDDILIGSIGNDSLSGDSGDDILEDGGGSDTLNGGNGADLFVMRSDGIHDVIVDFQPGADRIDLSDWPMLYGAEQMTYLATATGALIGWRGETLEIVTRTAQTLTLAEVQAAYLAAPHRVPDFTSFGGNTGDQTFSGSAIDDAIDGGGGQDTIHGMAGNDYLLGGEGHDWIDGGPGNDTLLGNAGNDRLIGGFGNDSLLGEAGDDTLEGGDGADTLLGGAGADLLLGGPSTDMLIGGSGFDTLDGGDNSDVYIVDGGDLITDTGTVGYDKAQINDPAGAMLTLAAWSGVERVNGFTGNDRIDAAGASQAYVLSGDGGNDTLIGGTGNDILLGGAGNDSLVGGAGNDQLLGGSGNDTFDAGPGNDVIFVGESGDVVVDGGAGFDKVVINATGGLSLMVGTWRGVERINGHTGSDLIDATGAGAGMTFDGRAGNDTLIGGAGNDVIYAGDGNDLLQGAGGDDALIGGAGDDWLDGGAGNDFLQGGAGADRFIFTKFSGTDVVEDFEDGTDRLDFSFHADVGGLADLSMRVEDGNTILGLAGGGPDLITLAGQVGTLTIDDFIFG